MNMDEDKHLNEIIFGVYEQLRVIFESSKQAIYIYLDDTHKVCNNKLSSMLGYKSPEEWANVNKSFPTAFVAEESRMTLINYIAFRLNIEKKDPSEIRCSANMVMTKGSPDARAM